MPRRNGKSALNFHLNQFVMGISESGPRGQSAISAPNMFMLDLEHRLSRCDSIDVQWMGTTEKWSLPENGTPQLLQVGESDRSGKPFIDAQHPHSTPIMGLTLAEVHCFGDADKEGEKENRFTVFIAPRGEATAGPPAFMHRLSADGNPNVPLAHHLQDVFHIMSTVLGARFEVGQWTMEGSIFSGREPSPTEVNLDLHRPDSGALRASRILGDTEGSHFILGASAAYVNETHRGANSENPSESRDDEKSVHRLLSTWLTSSHRMSGATLRTATIYGSSLAQNEYPLQSFLHEATVRWGKAENDRVFFRVELLQRTAEQLAVSDLPRPLWVRALTLGYERAIRLNTAFNLGFGGSMTQLGVPNALQPAYGKNPRSAEVHLRINAMKGWSWGKAPE